MFGMRQPVGNPGFERAGVDLTLAIWDDMIETLSCVGYDHNWVRTYSL